MRGVDTNCRGTKMKTDSSITDPTRFLEILRRYLLEAPTLKPTFIPSISCKRGVVWNGEEIKGGLTIEGSRPLSICTEGESGEVRITFTNGDSQYTRPIGTVRLDEIEYMDFFYLQGQPL